MPIAAIASSAASSENRYEVDGSSRTDYAKWVRGARIGYYYLSPKMREQAADVLAEALPQLNLP